MPEPDLGPVLSAATQYGDDIEANVRAELAGRVDTLTLERDDALRVAAAEKTAHDKTRALLTAAVKQYADHMATHPVEGPTVAQKSIGIQTFFERTDLSYGKDRQGTFDMLKFLGVKNIRANIGPTTDQTVIDWWNRCTDELGIELAITVGKPRVPLTAGQWDTIAAKLGQVRGAKALHSWNEPNHQRNPTDPPLTNWQANAIRHGYELHKRFGGTHEIGSAQLWSGNRTTHHNDLRSLAAASVTIDGKTVKYADTFETIVWHLYQSGVDRMADYETIYRSLFGDRPIVCSETGMSTAPNQAQGAASMTEAGQADYIKQHLGMYLAAGHKVYWFELRDEFDPDGTDREDWLGIFRHDGTPKPAANALRELLTA